MMGLTDRTRAWLARSPVRVGIYCLLALYGIDLTLVDRWQVKGQVFDQNTSQPVRDALVLAIFEGQEPLINLPLPPHPNSRYGVCMGFRSARTDHNGQFRFDVLAGNRALANKSAFIQVIATGRLREVTTTGIHSSIFLWAPNTRISLKTNQEVRNQASPNVIPELSSKLPGHEFTFLEQISELTGVLMQDFCGDPEPEIVEEAMYRALTIAQTFNERSKVVGACRFARRKTRVTMQSKVWKWFSKPTYQWPFDCDNLKFEKEPSAATLEVEEILRSRRVQATSQ
jgi:hypothetical protein